MEKNYRSLRPQLLRLIIVIYIITSLAALTLIYLTLNNKIEDLGTRFSTQYLLKEKSRITSPVEKEIALAQKMVDTPILKKWAKNENNEQFQEMALTELESYRQHFQDKSYFFIVDDSQNYYFNNRSNEYADNQYQYTLEKDNEDDAWYYATMENTEDYSLNVNFDRELKTTKLWINTIMKDEQGEKIGMGGTGLTLDSFLNDFLRSDNSYITPILFDKNGFIQAYEDSDYIQLSSITTDLSEVEDKTIFELLDLGSEKEQIQSMMEGLQQNEDEIQTLKLNLNEENRIAALSYIPALNWYSMILLDTSEIFSFQDFTFTIAILIISLLIVVLVIVYFLNKIVINPINRLTDFTEIVGRGNYDRKIKLDADNELGQLANSFNSLVTTIRKHTNNLEELVKQRTAELTKSNQELAEKNDKIMENIAYASYIQQSILPAETEFSTHFANHFVIWKPRDKVGGDFYWLKEIDNQLLVAVIDCTGHGVPGALMTMTASAVLNRIIDTEHTKNPGRFLTELNQVLKETLHGENKDLRRDDGLDIGLCSINKKSGELVFAGAKIALYYSEDGDIVRIKGDRHSVGYQRSRASYEFTNHTLDIQNKTFYLTTDGLLDQNGGKDNKRLGRKNFVSLLKDNCEQDLSAQAEIYEEKLNNFMGQKEQRDDITLLGFRVTP